MTTGNSAFQLPPTPLRNDGSPRRVGFELEFSGIGLNDASAAVALALAGKRVRETTAEHAIEVPGLGNFIVEIDWSFLKRKASEVASGELEGEWVE